MSEDAAPTPNADNRTVTIDARRLGRVYAILGREVIVHGTAPGTITPGMRIIADDNIAGTTPRSGCATVESVDAGRSSVTVDDPWSANMTVGDYLFEMPPTAAEILEQRVANLERRVHALEWR